LPALEYIPLGELKEPVAVAIMERSSSHGIGVDAPAVRAFLERQTFLFGRHSEMAFHSLHSFI
jgi:hypothetical protein